MNPMDNIQNIDQDYIPEILDQLPEKERARFRDGLFNDETNGNIYYAFNRENNVSENVVLRPDYPIYVGMDFNRNPMTAVLAQTYNETIYVFDEAWLMSSDTGEISKYIAEKYGPGHTVIPDSTGKRLQTSSSGYSDFISCYLRKNY
jgi:hypothetical protein